jgi:hypothetical protein
VTHSLPVQVYYEDTDFTGVEAVLAVGPGQDGHRVHRLDPGVLLELDRGERAVGGPDLGLAGLHAVEGRLPMRWLGSKPSTVMA